MARESDVSPDAALISASDWQAELERTHELRPFRGDSPALEVLRHRFRDISARTRVHRAAEWISRPEFEAVRQLSDQSLEFSRLAQHELAKHEQADAATVPVDLLVRLLEDDQARLDEIDRQLRLIDSWRPLAEAMRPVVASLVEGRGVSIARLRPILEQLDATKTPKDLLSLIPTPGLSLKRILEAGHERCAGFMADAIQRATWTKVLMQALPEAQPYPSDIFLVPALLADCGLLVSPDSQRRHPEVGAALISRIDGGSPLWSTLTSLHHERLDGTGLPRQLTQREMPRPARCFVTIVRWTELLAESAKGATIAEVVATAARALWQEASQGAFESESVSRLLAAIHPELPSVARGPRDDGRRWMIHAAQKLPAPHAPQPASVPPIRQLDPLPSAPATSLGARAPNAAAQSPAKKTPRRTPPPRPARI